MTHLVLVTMFGLLTAATLSLFARQTPPEGARRRTEQGQADVRRPGELTSIGGCAVYLSVQATDLVPAPRSPEPGRAAQ